MKNRLEVAKKLLTSDGCLIVAIDKNEQAELTVLLKELFRNYEIHVITIVHNPEGTQAVGFSYTHEYAIFVVPSSKLINKKKVDVEWKDFIYQSFGRDDSVRSTNNSCFYPIIIEKEKIIDFGEILDEKEHPEKPIIEKDNKLYVWPTDEKGIEGRWRWIRSNVESKKDFFVFERKINTVKIIEDTELRKKKRENNSPAKKIIQIF